MASPIHQARFPADAHSKLQMKKTSPEPPQVQRKPGARNFSPTGPVKVEGKPNPIRPAIDVLSRIMHDSEHFPHPEEIIVGYEDRHEGVKEISALAWRRESTDEEWIPQHRIRYFKRSAAGVSASDHEDERIGARAAPSDEEILWDRKKRIDLIFGKT